MSLVESKIQKVLLPNIDSFKLKYQVLYTKHNNVKALNVRQVIG